jgi:hypothetical protein
MQAAIGSFKLFYKNPIIKYDTLALQTLLFKTSLINLFIVSILGVLLRAIHFLSSFPLSYKNLLHGHSHFAFGGWVMPAILALLMKCFPEIEKAVAYKHWRNISFMLLFSAYGMLVAFPLQGYKVLSISFSTLSVLGGFYLAIVIWKAITKLHASVSLKFLAAGLFYLVLSSIGPFATGPLIAMGKTGTPIYFDVIYFYLHFQYNGWFLFVVLALLYKYLEQKKRKTNGWKVFWLMNIACAPCYFLSILWHQPALVFNIIGGLAALVQCVAVYFLVLDLRSVSFENKFIKTLVLFSMASLIVKALLQLFSALPFVARLAYEQRNFVIAYLHLVLLGFISLFLVGWLIKYYGVTITAKLKAGMFLFLLAFICSEIVLVIWPVSNITGSGFAYYSLSLLLASLFLPIGIAFFSWQCIDKRLQRSIVVL